MFDQYEDVINIVVKLQGMSKDDLVEALTAVAKRSPSVFLDSFKENLSIGIPEFDELLKSTRKRIILLLSEDQKIQAIKELRGLTGLSLKDAKDIVEKLKYEYGVDP